ncbi:hypothetical protein PRIPAC_89198 [Pristionchus pacificus]|uniref:Uncharacterized protein n=1 Tax=Pristionchus pacificus TaxID=54126 RepID=A0A2A6B8A7_PRIPA|nr:hypothetical protein PRIPAC_89198 [Pristionchus pacificus]|eukprot:PDM62104.1 hypothetical protein PRIPAC_51546 [Pristionchus pacificus]
MDATTTTTTTTTESPCTESNTQLYIWMFVGVAIILVTIVSLIKWYCRHKLIAAAVERQQEANADMAQCAAPPCQPAMMPVAQRRNGKTPVASKQAHSEQNTKTEREMESGSTEE